MHSTILRKHRTIVDNDEVARAILPENSIRVSYQRGANLKELLAPSNPYKKIEPSSRGCFKCTARRCDCCKNFLLSGSSFSSTATGRSFDICKPVTCTSQNVIYLARCVVCDLQGVGSTVNFKTQLANYKSHIKYKRRTCSIVNHFIDVHGGEHSGLKFMLIDQNNKDIRKCENFWIGTLLTNIRGLNSNHDFVQQ